MKSLISYKNTNELDSNYDGPSQENDYRCNSENKVLGGEFCWLRKCGLTAFCPKGEEFDVHLSNRNHLVPGHEWWACKMHNVNFIWYYLARSTFIARTQSLMENTQTHVSLECNQYHLCLVPCHFIIIPIMWAQHFFWPQGFHTVVCYFGHYFLRLFPSHHSDFSSNVTVPGRVSMLTTSCLPYPL